MTGEIVAGREEWEAMDSGIAFLGRGGSKDQDFCWVSIDCPFTDLSKGGDTTEERVQSFVILILPD